MSFASGVQGVAAVRPPVRPGVRAGLSSSVDVEDNASLAVTPLYNPEEAGVPRALLIGVYASQGAFSNSLHEPQDAFRSCSIL